MSQPETHLHRVAMITGGSGFVGRHLRRLLLEETSWEIWSTAREPAPAEDPPSGTLFLDIRQIDSVRHVVKRLRPAYVFHLAAATPVHASADFLGTNVLGAALLLEAIHLESPGARVLIVGSDAQYGPQDSLPTAEDAPMRPLNAYGRSKVLQEAVARSYHSMYGMDVICVRPFNIFGPGQSEKYVLGALARRVGLAELGEGPAEIELDSPEAKRDLTDVRDVARAYLQLALMGERGGVYNVGSGIPLSVTDLAAGLARKAETQIVFRPGRQRKRGKEVRETSCDSTRLRSATAWRPSVPLEKTLEDTLHYWRRTLSAAGQAVEGSRAKNQ